MIFYLGTHKPAWVADPRFRDIPLFISANRLRDRKSWPKAIGRYAIDSGGFSEIGKHGRWTISPARYVDDLRRWIGFLGLPDFAAPQDWMCEPVMIEKTGFALQDHQQFTTDNYLFLRKLAPEIPFVPVIQGWHYEDYMKHVDDYKEYGVNLASLPLVGVGSVCRRQDTSMAEELMRDLCKMGIRTHGFGFKLTGLRRASRWMASADSMAWSYAARRESGPLPGCTHRRCNNCQKYAIMWQQKAMKATEEGLHAHDTMF